MSNYWKQMQYKIRRHLYSRGLSFREVENINIPELRKIFGCI
jgi:hypothetical protein